MSFIDYSISEQNLRNPVDSILEVVLTVSPNKQYLGILMPTTPAAHGPAKTNTNTYTLHINSRTTQSYPLRSI